MSTNGIAPEQIRYAEWLRWSGWLGLAVLTGAFVVYVIGVLPTVLPVEHLPQLWRLPSSELMQRHGLEGGWSWIRLLGRGDMLNLLGIAILSGCSALPLLAVTGIYLRRGERIFAVLCLLQVAVLALAASGLIAPGH